MVLTNAPRVVVRSASSTANKPTCGGNNKAGLITNIGRKLPIMKYLTKPLPTRCIYTFSPSGVRRHKHLRMLG